MISSTISVPTSAFGDRALAAAEADAAEHGRRQHRDLEADADVAADRAEAGGEEQRADRGQHAAGDVAQRDRAAHRDAGIVGRAARAADRGDVPARPQAGQEDVAEDRDDADRRSTTLGTPSDTPPPMKSQDGDIGKAGGDRVRIVEQQQIVGGAVDDQRDQRGDEGAQPQIADQQAVDGAERRAARERRDDRPPAPASPAR